MALGELTFYLLERPAKPSEGILGNANAGIGDGKCDGIIGCSSSYCDAATCRREFYSVGKQIERNLLQRTTIGTQSELGRNARRDLQLLVLCPCANNAHGFVEQRVEVEVLEIKPDAASLDLRHVED